MDTREKAKKLIEARIGKLLGEFDFHKRKEKFPEECPCYRENKPCHEIPEKELNCFLCYCPEYKTDSEIGGCNIGNLQGKGKLFYHEALPQGKIWDCCGCSYPHNKKVAEDYFRKMFRI